MGVFPVAVFAVFLSGCAGGPLDIGLPQNQPLSDRAVTSCPLYWIPWEGACYRFFDHALTWRQAERMCALFASHIVSIHGPEENNFVYGLTAHYVRTWIGFNDINADGEFTWTDGTDENYVNWAPGQPDEAYSGEDCGEFWDKGGKDCSTCLLIGV
ncbi:VCAN [Branchiostoma lanceolatum]|uniref:VCAN protein n=1 Tax=Branchiostoma lanceolatum TaxID=7740 RepID=A0A8J9VHM3_BRALA|nr:VCAN [Branchiostoma lanceolatum]